KEFLVADEKQPNAPSPFDVRTIKNLVALMASHDLAEIDLRDGMQRLRIRRGGQQTVVAAAPMMQMPSAPSALPAPPPPPPPAPRGRSGKSGDEAPRMRGESVGRFSPQPAPGPRPVGPAGRKRNPTAVRWPVEAIKLFSEVQAGVSGTVVEVCVENQSPVEFG